MSKFFIQTFKFTTSQYRKHDLFNHLSLPYRLFRFQSARKLPFTSFPRFYLLVFQVSLPFLPSSVDWQLHSMFFVSFIKLSFKRFLSIQSFFYSSLSNNRYILIFLRISPRPISISQLQTLLLFHSWPINLIVYKGSYYIAIWDILSWGKFHA